MLFFIFGEYDIYMRTVQPGMHTYSFPVSTLVLANI